MKGTVLLGRHFQELITDFRDREADNYCFTTEGRLRYIDNWVVIDVCDDIARYYAHQLQKELGLILHWRARAGTHVSVIRGETPLKNAESWGFHQGKRFEVKYTHQIYTNREHFWLNIKCPELKIVRDFYGLQTKEHWFHLTVGRV